MFHCYLVNQFHYHTTLDFVTGSKFSADAEVGHATVEEGVPEGWMGLDVGPKSVEDFVQVSPS
jgi:phosphoglycerate kinase